MWHKRECGCGGVLGAGAERDVLQRGLEGCAPLGGTGRVAHREVGGAWGRGCRKELLDRGRGGRCRSRVRARAALDRRAAAVCAVPAHRKHLRALCVHVHVSCERKEDWGVVVSRETWEGMKDKPTAHVRRSGRPSWRTWLRTKAARDGAGAGGGLRSAVCGAQSSWPASTRARSSGSRRVGWVPLLSVAVIHSQKSEVMEDEKKNNF